MWFQRKAKNRRLKRHVVLDVKLRSDQVRAARLRMVSLSMGILFGVMALLFVCWRAGQWGMTQLFFDNPAFAIRNVDVETDGVLRVDQLRRWAGIKPGDNLLALDLLRVKRDIELSPLVQSVAVQRIMPDTVRIRVAEREPLARVNCFMPDAKGGIRSTTFQFDETGFVMVPLEKWQLNAPSNEVAELPLLSGVNALQLRPGHGIASPEVSKELKGSRDTSPEVLAALKLIRMFDQSPMVGLVDIKQIDVSSPGILHVYTGQGGDITLGTTKLDVQLRRWRAIYDYGLRTRRAIASVDLSISDNIPARWIEAAAVPLPNAKSKTPARTKKKNA